MGCWMIGTGVLCVEPKPTEELIKEYVLFSRNTNPYEDYDEFFSNPWFFDEDNNLQSIAGKFAEPSVWLMHIETFFAKHGYKLIGDPVIEGESLYDFWKLSDENYSKYLIWKDRIKVYSL